VVQLRGCRSQTGLQGLLIFCGLRNRAPQFLKLGTHEGIKLVGEVQRKLQQANQFLDVGEIAEPSRVRHSRRPFDFDQNAAANIGYR
jgi:hypothetical protein